jgi:hypothetical protein
MKPTQDTPVTHRLDYAFRDIPDYKGKAGIQEYYYSPLPIEIQEAHIRQSMHLYAPESWYILIRIEGTVDEPLFAQPLNMLNRDVPEYGIGLRKPLTENHPYLQSALAFWKHAKPI